MQSQMKPIIESLPGVTRFTPAYPNTGCYPGRALSTHSQPGYHFTPAYPNTGCYPGRALSTHSQPEGIILHLPTLTQGAIQGGLCQPIHNPGYHFTPAYPNTGCYPARALSTHSQPEGIILHLPTLTQGAIQGGLCQLIHKYGDYGLHQSVSF